MMDERERRDIMLRAIHRYGEAAQIDMAVEEMAELTKALCKVKRATPGATTTARGEVVSCEIVPGANATDAGYRPHWATCPQADRFKRGGRHHE